MKGALSACVISFVAAIGSIQSAARGSGMWAPAEYYQEPQPAAAPSGGATASAMPFDAQVMDQSTFAMGTMVWNVVFVQGDGSIQTQQETWTPSEISAIQGKISEAESYWEGLTSGFHPNARLSISVNYMNGAVPVTTGYEPSIDQSEVWINPVMNKLGYTNSNRYINVRSFNQNQRVANGTNWATTIFILDNTSAYLTRYAYAYYGGPFTILENDSAGWGPQNFNMVLSHEMGHIFFANDEYYASGARTSNHGGYLNVANTNAERDASGGRITPPQPDALMLNNGDYYSHVPYSPSVPSKEMFGLRDTNGNGVPDILDTPPSMTGSNVGSDPNTGQFAFSGNIMVTRLVNQNPLNVGFSNSQYPMTINTISSAYYRLDSETPVLLPAGDGAYGGYIEPLGFSIPGLSYGQHIIDVYGYNSVDNLSNIQHFTFDSMVPEPTTLFLLGLGGLAMLRRRK